MSHALSKARRDSGCSARGPADMIEALVVGQLYSNEEIFKSLKVSNAGGVRLSLQDKAVSRAVIMTSSRHSTALARIRTRTGWKPAIDFYCGGETRRADAGWRK